jgi:iron complex outermembrane recepter protein
MKPTHGIGNVFTCLIDDYRRTGSVLLMTLSAAVWSGSVVAQQPIDPAVNPAVGSANAQGLEEIIVTAQRRSETIKDVPFSVSAIGQDQLEQRHISTIEDVTRAIPGVSFGTGAVQGQDNITIRGIGSQTGNAAIGLYLDDVPIVTQNPWQPNTYTGATEPHFFDMNRIEVLRGPQGTLYGASSLGGAIRYISNLPDLDHTTQTFGSDLSATHHGGVNYDEQAVFNTVITPGVAAIRFGIDYGQDSGWIDHNTFLSCGLACQQGEANTLYGAQDQTGVNSQLNVVARLSGEIKPTDGLSILGSLFYQQQYSRDTSLFYSYMGLWNEDKLVPERGLDTMYVPSLTVNANLGWGDLTSVSSAFIRENKKISDGTYYNSDFIGYLADFVYPDLMAKCPNCGVAFDALPGPADQDQTTKTISQEFRLASKTPLESGLPFSWIGGLFVSDKAIHVTDNEYITGANALFTKLYGEPLQDSGFGVAAPNDDFGYADVHEDERQYAAFGEFAYDITADLKATIGDRLIIAHSTWDYNPGGFFTTGISEVRNSVDYHGNTPKFAIDYKLSDSVSLYANATKGYRLGGFIEPVTSIQQCSAQFEALGIDPNHLPGTFKADHLWSYEVGEKSELFQHRLSVNASAYYIDWSQIQQSFVLPCGAPYIANFGTATSHGGELELLGKLTQALTIGLNAGATHAYLTSTSPNVGASTGQDLLNTPSWSASLTGEYERPINDATHGFVRADYDWVGPSHGTFSVTDPDYVRPSYSILNAAAGLNFGNVEVSLYGKNLLSDYKVIQHVLINSLESAYTLRPLTVGIRVIVRLGPSSIGE